MTSGSFRSVSRPRNRRKSQSARLRVLASQSEVALDRSETFLRNQDPMRTLFVEGLRLSRRGCQCAKSATERDNPAGPASNGRFLPLVSWSVGYAVLVG